VIDLAQTSRGENVRQGAAQSLAKSLFRFVGAETDESSGCALQRSPVRIRCVLPGSCEREYPMAYALSDRSPPVSWTSAASADERHRFPPSRFDFPNVAGEVARPTEVEEDVFSLGERCAQAYREADALHYRAMALLAEFDAREGYREAGFGSTAEWLAWRIGIKAGSARERVRTALALRRLPQTARAMREGALSFSKVRAVTRVATPENEAQLLDFAKAGSAANLERLVKGWKQLDRRSEVDAEQARFRTRTLSAFVDEAGMVVVRGRLDPEAGAMLMKAIDDASDALFRKVTECVSSDRPTPEQRRADALGLVAERALATGFGEGPVSGSKARATGVVLHVDALTLSESEEPGLSELEDGTRVAAETSRRIACDTGVARLHLGERGEVKWASRRRRTVSPSLRRALEARDRGCRFPGCGLRFTDAHHIRHWADGGETTLTNLVLLCRRHHRAVHEGGMKVCLAKEGEVVFFAPGGRAVADAPEVRAQRSAARGPTDPRGPTHPRGPLAPTPSLPAAIDLAPRWKRDADIPWEIEANAWEALETGVQANSAAK